MKDVIAFARITKVDEAKQMVYGRAVQEVPDRANEIFDYATSKPHFEAWSKSQSDASMGKSHGNIRVMHTAKAAGIVVPNGMVFHDDECAIDYVVKITDAGEFSKCMDGTYTGFSIGGSYVKKWPDADNPTLTRYTAKPSETSLVDRPCVGTATFTAIKADGTTLEKAFKPPVLAAPPVVVTRKDMIEYLTKKVPEQEAPNLGFLDDEALTKQYTEQRTADQAAIDAGPVLNVEVGSVDELEQFATLLAQKKMTLGDVIKVLVPVVDPYAPAPADIVLRAKAIAKGMVTPAAVEAAARTLCEKAGKNPDARKQEGDYSVQAWMEFRKQAEFDLQKVHGGDAWKAHVVTADRQLRDEKLGITPEKHVAKAEELAKVAGVPADDTHHAAALEELRAPEREPFTKRDAAAPAPVHKLAFGKGKFADTVNSKYPLDTVDQVRAAWAFINKAHAAKLYDAEAITTMKATIAEEWKSKVDKAGPPTAEKAVQEEMSKIDAEVVKGMYTVGTLARILDDLSYVCSSAEYEAKSEGDGSMVPGRLAACLKELGAVCVSMCVEEVAELSAPRTTGEAAVARADKLLKAGARNSAADSKRIQTVHDHAVELGAKCGTDEAEDEGMTDKMEKVLKDNADTIAKLEARLKVVEDQPAQTRVNAVLKVVTRGQAMEPPVDAAGGEVQPVLKANGEVDVVATAIKKSHATGGQLINPKGRVG